MSVKEKSVPDHTAIRVALWRAMHVLLDSTPYVFEDELALKLAAPEEGWRERGDMHPEGTKGYRASIVGRARFIEDLLEEKMKEGVSQYVILGAGLDTFAQRKPELLTRLKVFEIDEPATQIWKQDRLKFLGWAIPPALKFVPVDFESGDSWTQKLEENGFESRKTALVVSTGVSMYLSREANLKTLKKVRQLSKGTTFAMTFMLPPELVEPQDRPGYEMVLKRTAEAGTPFLSLLSPEEAVKLAKEAGFTNIQHVSRKDIIQKYFKERKDSLEPSSGEEVLVVTV